jgi:hypothetical protein
MKKIKSIKEKLLIKKYEQIKTIKDEIIEDNDAYLNKKDKISQVIPKIRKNLYESANKTPREVATPFPPLNFNQMGKI